MVPKTQMDRVSADLATLAQNGFAEVLIPKLIVFGAVWRLGVRLCFVIFLKTVAITRCLVATLRPFLLVGALSCGVVRGEFV